MISPPRLSDAEEFRGLRGDPQRWLPLARDIARSHGYAGSEPTPFATGTNLVVGIGGRLILKIFPPMYHSQFLSERGALRVLAGRVRIAIPELVHEGERERWTYLIMTRLSGELASDVWPGATEAAKERLLGQLGETIAEVQRVPPGELAQIAPDWATFMQGQIAGCRARHRRLGLPDKFLARLDALLSEAQNLIPMTPVPVILTGEYIPENFLVARRGDGWAVSGLFDFGDVLTGWGEYDLLGPSAFMAAGHPERVRSLLAGYGYAKDAISGSLKRRLLALMLLHRASDPLRHLCIQDWPSKAANLDQLQELIWPG